MTEGKPKRFLVFTYGHYYPRGGWSDLTGSFDTYEEAKTTPTVNVMDEERQIIDLETGQKWTFPVEWTPEPDTHTER